MDSKEINRRVVGLLTLSYNTNWDPETGDIRPVQNAIGSLLEGFGTYNINVPIPEDYAAMVRQAVEDEMVGLRRDVTEMIAHLVLMFTLLSQEVKKAYPDADIDGFLRRLGSAASGD